MTVLLRRHPFLPVPFLFYYLTCSRTVGSGAPAMHIDTVMRHTVSTHVDCHNLTMLTGWIFSLFPVGELAFRLNLVSSFFGALAVVLFYFALLEEFGERRFSALGAALLMVTYSVWWHATIFESYATNAFLTTLALWLFARLHKRGEAPDLYAICFVAGLAVFNHVENGFLCLGALVAGLSYARRQKNPATVIASCATFALVGLAPWLVTFIKDWMLFRNLHDAFNNAFFGPFKGMMLAGSTGENVRDLLLILLTEHPNLFLLAIPIGFYSMYKSWGPSPALAGVMTACTLSATFAFTYQTWNKYSHGQLALVVFVFAGCFALHDLWAWLPTWKPWEARPVRAAALALFLGNLLLPAYVYARITTWAANPDSIWNERYNGMHTPGAYPLSDYIANPDKHGWRGFARYVQLLGEKLPKDAIYFDDDGRSYYQIADYYQKHLGFRSDIDVELMNSFGYDDIGWGNEPNSTAVIINNAYFADRDLFTISLDDPFSRALETMPDAERFQFTKFPLDDGYWVYRLVTQREEAGSFLSRQSTGWKAFKPVVAPNAETGAETLTDFSPETILFLSRAQSTQQDMRAYGNFWSKGDQLFIRADIDGGWAETMIESASALSAGLEFNLTTAVDYGRIDIFLNDKIIAPGIDLYSPDVFHRVVTLHDIALEQGRNRLEFKLAGKNEASQGYVMGLDYLRIRAE